MRDTHAKAIAFFSLLMAASAACGAPAAEELPIAPVDDSRRSALLLVQDEARLDAGESALQAAHAF